MHIPSGASQTVELLSFPEALALSGKSGGYDAETWLYVPDFYTEYRYILGTRGRDPLICIGITSPRATALTAGSCSTSTRSAQPDPTTWT